MKRFIKNLFLKNWGLKLFSFFLALVLWLALIPEEKTFSEKTLTIPVELHNIASDMELLEEKPLPTVNVTVRAPKRVLNDISANTVHAILDLKNASTEQEEYRVYEENITIPEGAEVKEVRPSQVKLMLERTKEIVLGVEPRLIGKLQDGLILQRIEVIPPQVLIKGPESKIKDKYKVQTSPIDISKLNQSTEIKADLILPHRSLRLASSEKKVTIRIFIQEETEQQEKETKVNKKYKK